MEGGKPLRDCKQSLRPYKSLITLHFSVSFYLFLNPIPLLISSSICDIIKQENFYRREGETRMKLIQNQTFEEERALYGLDGIRTEDCTFDGPADGESAFKECRNVEAVGCSFNLRYPFWHDVHAKIEKSEMTPLCRAALWYCEDVTICDSILHGIKALRECTDVKIQGCDIISPEFGWFVRGITMTDCSAVGEYFMMRSERLNFKDVRLTGKYSFQYITDSVFEDCYFDTKDAFWHAKNIVLRNCTVKGEYLAWYCENVTLENCKIVGTQPLCYCKNLKLINCEMLNADLCFERSEVEATVTTPVISIKNPRAGTITVPECGEQIWDDPQAKGVVYIQE